MVSITHIVAGNEKKEVVHAENLNSDSSVTLCGEDIIGDRDRDNIKRVDKKITCQRCISVIWGVHKLYPLDCCDLKEVSKNRFITSLLK